MNFLKHFPKNSAHGRVSDESIGRELFDVIMA